MSVKAPHLYEFLAPLYCDLFSYRRKRRSNLCSNNPKYKERRLFPSGAEDDTSASPGDRQPACTSSTSVIETPNDQCRPAFHDNLVNTPQKRKTKKTRSWRKKLFQNSSLENISEKVTQLLPGFLQKLHWANLCFDFYNFIHLVCNNKFPLTNIALLLFLDAVRW